MSAYKDVVIRVKASEDLSKAENGSVLLFDRSTKCYYLVGPSELLRTTRKMLEDEDKKVAEARALQERTKQEEADFEARMIEKFNSFSDSIKESNSKLIDLVDKVVNGTTEDK